MSEHNFITYPSGEMRLGSFDYDDNSDDFKPAVIRYGVGFWEELIALSSATNTRKGVLDLVIPYIPCARDDKPYDVSVSYGSSEWKEAFSVPNPPLNVVISMLKTMFPAVGKSELGVGPQVYVLDPHTPVIKALWPEVTVLSKKDLFERSEEFADWLTDINLDSNTVICIPDAGATKSVQELADAASLDTVQILKKRDPKTGQLSDFKLFGNVKGKTVVVVDDICDGGGTFVGAAQLLKRSGAKDLHLYTTHGIYSRNLDCLLDYSSIRCFDTLIRPTSLTQTNTFKQFRVLELDGLTK